MIACRARRQRQNTPLRPAANRARQVNRGGPFDAAGQDKLLERRQPSLEQINVGLDCGGMSSRDIRPLGSGFGVASSAPSSNNSFCTRREYRIDFGGQFFGTRDVQARHSARPLCRRPRFAVVLSHAPAAVQARRSVVAGFGVDFHREAFDPKSIRNDRRITSTLVLKVLR